MDPNERAIALQQEVEAKLPEFVKLLRSSESDLVVLHQDAFAADYQDAEFRLLGMAIKYAGIFGKAVTVTGRNRESLLKR